MTTSQQKYQLRQKVRAERNALDPTFVQKTNHIITGKLKQIDAWQRKRIVHVYLPIEKSNEVDTWPIVTWLLEDGHEVWASYLPEDESQDGFCKINKDTKYKLGRYGIPLPEEKVQQKCQPDVIIAACVAVDKQGNRLGHGQGWTDRFFASHPNALKIGLAHNQFLFTEIPREPHDQRLDLIITEKGVDDHHH